MPGIFTFGIPNSFNFTFRAGPKVLSLAYGTIDVESNSNHNADSEASNKAKVLVSSSSRSTGNLDSSPCGTLNKLPLELRSFVYANVLRHEKYIRQARRFLGRHPSIMALDAVYLEAIDAALLRTCRAIYREAIRILYRMNRFHFRKPGDIKAFAHSGLGNTPFGFYRTTGEPLSAESSAPCGRFTMVRSMSLRISAKNNGDDRKQIWALWSHFFYPPQKQDKLVGFPALEWLALDLTDLELSARDASKVRVKPFLTKLRPACGLRHLTLIGVGHEQNLRDFKHGFVREGGTFRPASSSVKGVETTTVTHDNLPEVSMYVRAIVENERVSRATLQSHESAAPLIRDGFNWVSWARAVEPYLNHP